MEALARFDINKKEWVLFFVNEQGKANAGGTDEHGNYINAYRIPVEHMRPSKEYK